MAAVLLGAAAVAAVVAWRLVERRGDDASARHWVAAASVPAVLVGAAAALGLAVGPAGDGVVNVARATAVLAAASGGGVVATALLTLADRGTGSPRAERADERGGDGAGDILGDATASVSDPRTLRGGASIGILERIGVSAALLAGWPEGLAVVLGVKGLGRYPELRRPAASERFIIGTLASVLWATAAAAVVSLLRS